MKLDFKNSTSIYFTMTPVEKFDDIQLCHMPTIERKWD